MTADWHDAQVIEAKTPRFDDPRILLRSGEGYPDWTDRDYWEYGTDELSDVRVIVDRDGNMAPPPITDETVSVLARELGIPRRGVWDALTAALGGDR